MKNLYFSLLPDIERSKYRTEKQWLKLGFVPASQDAGTIMYSNRFCTGKYRYLTSEEVRKATDEEMTSYHEEQRRKRRSRYLQAKKEREQAIRYGELLSLCDQQRQLDEENYRGTIPTLTVSIDIETTGLDCYQDEIIQISILDVDTGEVLLDSYVRPYFTEDWPEARRVNHITKEMVCNAPYFYELLPQLNQVLAQVKTIVGYNFAGFDSGFLTRYGASFNDETIVEDLSNIFADINGEFSPKHGDFKFMNLSTCADYFGYDWGEETAHNSLADCRATAFCYKKSLEENYQIRYQENIHKRDWGFFDESDESYDEYGDYNG